MAETQEKTDYPHMAGHVATWSLFTRLGKWVIAICIALLIGMALFLTGSHDQVVR